MTLEQLREIIRSGNSGRMRDDQYRNTFDDQTVLLMIDALERSRRYINSRKALENQKELDWDMFEGADNALEALTKHLEEREGK